MRPDSTFRTRLEELRADHRPRRAPELLPFPTPAQLDLLKAALMPVEVAAPAWRRWKSRGLQLETVDEASGRMYSQLWANREAAGVDAEDLPLLKGVYRQSLARNAVTLTGGLQAAGLLTDAGIPVVFIKGAAMIAAAEGRLGLRRIVDVDLLVPESDAERALEILLAAGYESDLAPPRFAYTHGWNCHDSDGCGVDLHWSAFKTAGDDSGIFQSAISATLLQRPVLLPSVTDCLVMAVATAFPGNGSPLRWVADAIMLFEVSGGEIDWDTVIERARRPGVSLGLTAGLEFLAREFSVPVPDRVLVQLQRLPSNWRERLAYWSAVRGIPARPGPIEFLERHWARRLHDSGNTPPDFLLYMAQATGRNNRRELLTAWLAKAASQCLPAPSPRP